MSEKWVKLANSLINLTEAGKLDWEEMSDTETFQTVIGFNAIEFEQTGYGDDFEIRLRDGNGRVVDRFSDVTLTNMTGEPYHALLRTMFDLIQRRIAGSEQILDDVLKQLESR